MRHLFLFFVLSAFVPCGLIAEETQIVFVTVSADSENDGYEAFRAMDGNPGTMWHTQFSARPGKACPHPISCGYGYACGYDHPGNQDHEAVETEAEAAIRHWGPIRNENNAPCPHEFRIDLGDVYELKGFVYMPREDGGNGTFGEYEVYAHAANFGPNEMGAPVLKTRFERTAPLQRVVFEKPVKARYLKFVQRSERNGQPFGSIAELELLCDGVIFRADSPLPCGAKIIARMPDAPRNERMKQERIDEWNILVERFKTPDYWEAIENEVYDRASLILPEDRDPVDVVLRRTGALIADLYGPNVRNAAYENLKQRADRVSVDETDKRFELFADACQFRREVLLESPASPLNDPEFGVKNLLFVKRHRSTYQHMVDQYYGRTQRPGGGIYVMSLQEMVKNGPYSGENTLQNLLANSVVENGRLKGRKLEGGSFLSPDLSFDGKKLAFAYVECRGPSDHVWTLDITRGHWDEGRCFHIFTCNADGSELRQITDGTWNDFDPCWLPNGRIAFISERRNGYLRCGRECPTYTLFDMNADGSKMRCLSFHETNEWNPSVTNDGKILYTRWDYVDRYGCIVHHPWITTLDGRDPREVHGNYSHRHRRADTEVDCRVIPDSHKFIATGGPHHGQAFGSLLIVDPRIEDDDAMGPCKRITPEVGFPESQGGGEVYGTPWPINEKYFLCVADFGFQPKGGVRTAERGRGNDGIYLCDVFGNRELIYRDPTISSISPMPLAARSMPHNPPSVVDVADIEHQTYVGIREKGEHAKTGIMSLVNVYDSMRPFPEDAKIKELRIIQLLPMSVPSGAPPHHTGIQEASSLDSVNLARAVLGTVPVEEDGSAHFIMPAQVEFQFQALDENGCAVQSMRSSSYVQPGENLSCNGCHEPKMNAPVPISVLPTAFSRPPSEIKPETVPGAYPFSYPLLVQPILDKHCVDCHDDPDSNTFSLRAEPVRNRFYASYNNLAPKYGYTSYGEPLRTTPGKFGARAAPLYHILQEGHHDVALSDEEMHRIVIWLDCLSNFYGVYEKDGGEAQLRGEVVWPTLE